MTGTIWNANFPDFFVWAEWKGQEPSVVFHQGSGETLLLNPLGAFLLKTVCNEPISIETLAQLTAQYFDLPLDEELTRAISMSLHTFEQKGLILSTTP